MEKTVGTTGEAKKPFGVLFDVLSRREVLRLFYCGA
jgi:hypothetical protein